MALPKVARPTARIATSRITHSPHVFSHRYYQQRRAARAFFLKDYHCAIKHLNALNREVPDQLQTLYLLALSHERLQHTKEAITLSQQALAIDPQHCDSLQLMARTLISCQRETQAVAFVQRALAVLPKPQTPWWVRFLRSLNLAFLCPQSESSSWREWAHAFLEQQTTAPACPRNSDTPETLGR